MITRNPRAQLYRATPAVALLSAALTSWGCLGELGSGSAEAGGPECTVLDFDTDGDGAPIAGGDVVEEAYASMGVHLDVWKSYDRECPGLGVAFDTDNPTGGDDDLSFSGLGNALINQEHFDQTDVQNGFVDEPDDEARGALFEFTFDEGVCVPSLVLLDIDFNEDPAEIKLYDADDQLITEHFVDPMGDNVRLDVELPSTECKVRRMTVFIDSSGAMDELTICRGESEPEIWEDSFDGGSNDEGADVAADADRNVYVAGSTQKTSDTDGLLRKYDSGGVSQWTEPIDGGFDDAAEGVAVAPNGDPIVVGGTGNGTDRDLFVRRYDPEGNVLWERKADGGAEDSALDVAVDDDGDIVVVGYVTIAGGTNVFVRKYAPDGDTEWTMPGQVGPGALAHGVAIDDAGDVYVAGQTDNGTDSDIWVRKVNGGNGFEVWTELFDGGGDDVARGISVGPDGNPVAVGYAWTGSDSDIFVRKYDAGNGDDEWTRVFGGSGADQGTDAATDAAGNVIVHGTMQNATFDGWTRKLDPTGQTPIWTEVFDRGEADVGSGVAVDIAGSVLATGYFDNGTDLDLWIAKYRP